MHSDLVNAIRLLGLSAIANRRSELFQHSHGGFPAYTGVRYADALDQTAWSLRWYFLVSLVDIRFNHDTDDAILSSSYLVGDCLCYLGLIAVVFVGVS
jgi:hypothetical protein